MYDVLFEENEARFENIVYLVFLELRFFSTMFPSMPKGEIVSMNADDIIMGEYCRTLTCCIHDCVCH